MTSHLIARLAAANPVPTEASGQVAQERRTRTPRRRAAVVAVAAVIAVPAVALAARFDLFGLSNHGTPVATSSIDLSQDSGLSSAMRELGFPSTLARLGSLDGVTFYAARRPDGDYCFAIESAAAKGVGCDLDGSFPSASRPVMVFPPLVQFAGFAADGVAEVVGVDASGHTVVSAPVRNNLFAATADGPFATVTSIEALDGNGNVISTRRLRPR